jgi:superfamily I DNA/RNA helicase
LIPDLDIPEKDKPKYIVIDEVRDVFPSMFSAMRYVKSKKGYCNVFGDLNQNIFGQRVTWFKMLGINIKKVYRLDFNYRNNYEIGSLASQI